jgi:hypothetical protein
MIISSSILTQLLSLIPRHKFRQAVSAHQGEQAAKGFSCWDQLVAMLFCHLGSAGSLREIHGGLATAQGKLRHLGLDKAPSRSTLSYANHHRSWAIYRDTFYAVLESAQALAAGRKRRFRFKNKVVSIDASIIDLCCSVFDWARYRRTKGAVKLHLMLNHQNCLPCWALVTDGKVHDVRPARNLSFSPGTIVVCDRGYTDYGLFAQWCEENVFFVTRLKSNAAYGVLTKWEVPVNRNILADDKISFTGPMTARACPYPLRRVVVWDAENEREIVLLTNNHKLGATTIARLYKDRWQIELFFKALKQNLKIKTFVGTSRNAVQIQIWTALLAMLLLKVLQFQSTLGWSLSHLAAMIRMNLMIYRDLWAWLDDPYARNATGPPADDLPLFARCLG